MTSQQLTVILAEARSALEQNKAMVTTAILDEVEQLVAILSGGATNIEKMATMQGLDLTTIVAFVKTLVAHERVLIAGMQDTLLESIEKVQGRPLEIDVLAKLL